MMRLQAAKSEFIPFAVRRIKALLGDATLLQDEREKLIKEYFSKAYDESFVTALLVALLAGDLPKP